MAVGDLADLASQSDEKAKGINRLSLLNVSI